MHNRQHTDDDDNNNNNNNNNVIIAYFYSALRELNLELGALQVLKKSMIKVI